MALDLSEVLPSKSHHRAALTLGVGFGGTALAALPFATTRLTPSMGVFTLLVGSSIMAIAITAVLLWHQGRVARSHALTTLSIGFAGTGVAMTIYLLTFPGFFPPLTALLHTTAGGPAWTLAIWHAALVASVIIYRASPNRRVDTLIRRRTLAIALLLVVAVTVAVLYLPLPPLVRDEHWTAVYFLGFAPALIVVTLATIVSLVARAQRTTLDLWLVVVLVAMLFDLLLAYVGTGRYTVGWYASRTFVFGWSVTLLGVLLSQTAAIYEALSVTASRLSIEAATDKLTNLPNRRRFDEEAARLFADVRRRRVPLSIALLDIDRFKAYNDAFGHLAGDECLKAVAAIVGAQTGRATDFAARTGGEEFIIIMRDTDGRGAGHAIERIREAIVRARIPHAPGTGMAYVTISAGIAMLRDDEPLERAIARADAAMYRAKRDGRDRVANDDLGAAPAPTPALLATPAAPAGVALAAYEGQPG